MSWVSTAQLRRKLRRASFSDDEEESAADLIGQAIGVIEGEAGQSLLLSTDTVTLDGSGRSDLVLPRWPVISVDEVVELDDGEETVLVEFDDFEWSAAGILSRVDGVWPSGPRSVRATVKAGYATAPPELRKIVLRMVTDEWSNPEGLSQESLGDHSRAWPSPAHRVAGMDLSSHELRIISRYKART